MQIAGDMVVFVRFFSGLMLYAVEVFRAADACVKILSVGFGGLCLMALGLVWCYKCITVKVTFAAL